MYHITRKGAYEGNHILDKVLREIKYAILFTMATTQGVISCSCKHITPQNINPWSNKYFHPMPKGCIRDENK